MECLGVSSGKRQGVESALVNRVERATPGTEAVGRHPEGIRGFAEQHMKAGEKI